MTTPSADRPTTPVLVVQHEDICPPGWVGDWLVEDGCRLDVRRPDAGDRLPDDLGDHGGLVVLGGTMGAADDADFPWLGAVKELVRGATAPVLGVCLGHQLVAAALGGRVARNPRGQQIGVREVGWLPAASDDVLFGPMVATARRAVHWNNDVVTELPDGAILLARAEGGEPQVVRFGPQVWGVQAHPEADADICTAWAHGDRDDYQARGLDVDVFVDQVADARDELAAGWRPLAERFARLVLTGAAAA